MHPYVTREDVELVADSILSGDLMPWILDDTFASAYKYKEGTQKLVTGPHGNFVDECEYLIFGPIIADGFFGVFQVFPEMGWRTGIVVADEGQVSGRPFKPFSPIMDLDTTYLSVKHAHKEFVTFLVTASSCTISNAFCPSECRHVMAQLQDHSIPISQWRPPQTTGYTASVLPCFTIGDSIIGMGDHKQCPTVNALVVGPFYRGLIGVLRKEKGMYRIGMLGQRKLVNIRKSAVFDRDNVVYLETSEENLTDSLTRMSEMFLQTEVSIPFPLYSETKDKWITREEFCALKSLTHLMNPTGWKFDDCPKVYLGCIQRILPHINYAQSGIFELFSGFRFNTFTTAMVGPMPHDEEKTGHYGVITIQPKNPSRYLLRTVELHTLDSPLILSTIRSIPTEHEEFEDVFQQLTARIAAMMD